jgi:tetratricopeptide (TPR) repeat protein
MAKSIEEKIEGALLPAEQATADFFDRKEGAFFRRADWWAFWITFLVSFGVYFYTNAPTVTLEDSGELAVASDYLGVPHPPGYPIWTLVTWFFQWIFHWVRYYGQPDGNLTLVLRSLKDVFDGGGFQGHPNPAWSVSLSSGFFSALAAAFLAQLVSRSGGDILRGVVKATEVLGLRHESLISGVAGITGGLLFAFSPVLWSQATIVEVYGMNAFFMALVMLLVYRWMSRPQEDKTLYVTSFVFGLGLTNHQALLFMAPALLAAIAMRDPKLFRDSIAGALWLIALVLFALAYRMGAVTSAEALQRKQMLTLVGVLFLASPIALFLIERKLLTEWKRMLLLVLSAGLGLSFYAYLPFASEQNPPMNWGYPRTPEGFVHAISRGQYEKIDPAVNFREAIARPLYFGKMLEDVIVDPLGYVSVVAQFSWVISLFAVFCLVAIPGLFIQHRLRRAAPNDPRVVWQAAGIWAAGFLGLCLKPLLFVALFTLGFPIPAPFIVVLCGIPVGLILIRLSDWFAADKLGNGVRWIIATFVAFHSLTVIFLIFQWPKLDVQTLFIGRVQYIQSHAIWAMWIAYGILFAIALLATWLKANRFALYGACALSLAVTSVPILKNAYDEEFIKLVGGAEQNGHDFGWQFGAWQLEGAHAILAEIPEEERARYPNPEYPPRMTTNAIFFGGTDPGRFVPTYMIYSAHYRSDVYLITQNALADNTYMNVMRDLYGDRIWIPSQQDSNFAFQKYVEDVRAGRIQAGADVSFEGGRVSVQGVQGVMTINGILARMIFEANKARHDFYVEESYVIPWMYPYLTPHGLIMKINRDPVPAITPEMVKNDRDFWDWYTERLLSNYKFQRDVVARKTFSKLRSAIAGLYAYRRMFEEAEYAFEQAIRLYPLSPEANFRLADIEMQQFRFSKAREVIENFLKADPGNDRVAEFLVQIRNIEALDNRRRELEPLMAQGADVNMALELANVYRQMNLTHLFESLTMNILRQDHIPPPVILQVAELYVQAQRADLLATALERYLQKEPANPRIWFDLAGVQAQLQRSNEAVRTLRRAIELGGEPVRDMARKDARFNSLRDMPEYRALVPPIQPRMDLPLNLNIPGF